MREEHPILYIILVAIGVFIGSLISTAIIYCIYAKLVLSGLPFPAMSYWQMYGIWWIARFLTNNINIGAK